MNASHAFARARPRAITMRETYRYKGEISRNTYLELDEAAEGCQGTITIEVPYDGQQCFSEQARQDVAAGKACGLQDHQAVIGYLAFGNAGHTDLPSRLSANLSSFAWPLVLPLSEGGADLQELIRRDAVARLQQSYRIASEALNIELMRASAGITDEGPGLSADGQGSPARHAFQPNLMLDLQVEVIVPNHLAPQEVILQQACLSWPYVTAPPLFRLQTQEGQSWNAMQPVLFDTTTQQVIWSDQLLPQGRRLLQKDPHPSIAAGYTAFHTPCMRLWTERSTDLHEVDRLEASFEILLKGVLLSGLQARAFDATGRPARWPIELSSALEAHLTLWLDDLFRGKIYTPRCFLVFEGVVASRERVDDIRALLQDMGFTITGEQPETEAGGAIRQFTLTAERTERARQMRLQIVLRGEVVQTEISTLVRGGRTYRTGQTTGRSTLEIVVSQAADHVQLTETLNELQQALKERFRHMRSIR